MLKILLPTTFPIAISYSPFLVATILVTNSGRLVPKATIVKATILSLIPNNLAISLAESTTTLLPRIKQAIPITVNNNDKKILYLGIASSSSFSVFIYFLFSVN